MIARGVQSQMMPSGFGPFGGENWIVNPWIVMAFVIYVLVGAWTRWLSRDKSTPVPTSALIWVNAICMYMIVICVLKILRERHP